MDDVVGIRYDTAGPIDYCSPGGLMLGVGDYVVVEKDGSEQLGWVVVSTDQVISADIERPLRKIERIASEHDVTAWEHQKVRAEEDVGRAQAMATRIDPRMRVASIVYDLSGEIGELSYTAPENISGDQLRRDVGELLNARFSARQVGERDRAKAFGPGVMGLCGRDLCCTSWMTSFPSVSVRMAKEQNLSPNPSKISGLCGRLLCCLSFEVEAYRELKGGLPGIGKRVTTPIGRAKVLSIDALNQNVRLLLDETGEVIEIEANALRAQYGTQVRPEELDDTVEAPARNEARALQEATIAILEPVDHPAVSVDSDTKSKSTEREKRKRPKRRRGRRGGRGRSKTNRTQ